VSCSKAGSSDKTTGKPVGGARVWYATFRDNPHVAPFPFPGNAKFGNLNECSACHTCSRAYWDRRDGTFELGRSAGRNVLGVRIEHGNYAPAELPEAEKDRTFWNQTVPTIAHSTKEFQAVKLIDVPENVAEMKVEMTVGT